MSPPTDKQRFKVMLNEPKLSVLIIDDDRTSRSLIAGLLKKQNVEITESCNGLDAIFDLNERRPDFIILDHQMPQVSGDLVYAAIRRRHLFKDIPVIVLSGSLDKAVLMQFLKNGKPEFLVKPVDPQRLEVLVQEIRKAKAGQKATDEATAEVDGEEESTKDSEAKTEESDPETSS